MVEIMEQFAELEKDPESVHETFRLVIWNYNVIFFYISILLSVINIVVLDYG
jgi:hypothetical protein